MQASSKRSAILTRLPALASVIGLILLIVLYWAIGTSRDANLAYGFKTILNQSVVVALVATGAVFIYTLGSFDISLGAATGTSALLGAMAYNATGSLWVVFFVCIGVAVLIGLINSVMANVFNIPVFVTTIAMMSVLGAVMLILIGINGTGDYIKISAKVVKPLDTTGFKALVLAGFIALCFFVFHLTGVGRKQKFVGGNPVCAGLTGIRAGKMAIIAFALSGLGMGLGAFLSIVYAPTLSQYTGSSIGMDVIIAIVFGGMPVSGGARSKVLSAVIGAFSMSFLSQIMTFLNLDAGTGQMIKAVIFLLIVWIAASSYRGKLLPR